MTATRAGLALAAFALAAQVSAQEWVPEPDGYRTENYRAPVPATLAGARVLSTAEAEKSAGWHGLARQATLQYSGQRLAARHGLWRIGEPDRRLSAARAGARRWRQQGNLARDLLPGGLLDVVERGQASAVLRLFEGGMVSGGNR